jgi:hypothetical protein
MCEFDRFGPFDLAQATRQVPGQKKGKLTLGKGGSSSSTAQTTNNVDKRWVVGEGATALALDNSVLQAVSDTTNNNSWTNTQSWQTSLADSRDLSTTINDSRDLSTYLSAQSSDTTNSNNTTNTTLNYLDGGAIDLANRSLDVNRSVLELSNATQNQGFSRLLEGATNVFESAQTGQQSGFSKLLDSADKLFESNQNALQNLGNTVANAYQTATSEKSGTLDNKTIMTLAALAAGTVALVTLGGKK